MDITKQLANRFREIIFAGKWVAATNYKIELSALTWEQAIKKVSYFKYHSRTYIPC